MALSHHKATPAQGTVWQPAGYWFFLGLDKGQFWEPSGKVLSKSCLFPASSQQGEIRF